MQSLDFLCVRFAQGTQSTISKLYRNGQRWRRKNGSYVYILEDQDPGLYRDTAKYIIKAAKKVAGTAIPATNNLAPYPVIFSRSTKFGIVWNEIDEIPEYDGVRCHAGNTIVDTLACPLAGIGKVFDKPDKDENNYYRVWDSQNTFKEIDAEMRDAWKRKIPITWAVERDY